ncbi:hypothetical protein GA0061102_1002112 [Rhizobium miluonense]|uniref:Uncharacterized protein n=1 Tax=Rhizobium miluonense TaxID=411945 RepID=A0A1C3U7T7_9HYPH|nr:hypothetical protein GA0061102_1002112 [Rhizobium miluonense]
MGKRPFMTFTFDAAVIYGKRHWVIAVFAARIRLRAGICRPRRKARSIEWSVGSQGSNACDQLRRRQRLINGFHRGRAVPTHLREALPNRHAAWQSSKNEARVDHPSSVPVRCHARGPHRADEHWARRQRNGFTRSKHDGCDEQRHGARHEYGRGDAMLPAEATPQARLLQRLSPGSVVHDILFRRHFA